MRPTRRAFLTVSGGAVLAAMRPSGLRAAGVRKCMQKTPQEALAEVQAIIDAEVPS